MTAGERRTIAVEAAIGAVINGVLSAGFMALVFGGHATITAAELQIDALPQTFMVALMSATVPTLLARRRVAGGKLGAMAAIRHPLPRHLLARGIAVALAMVLLLVPGVWLAVPALIGEGAAFGPVLVAKIIYGALLGAIVSAVAVRLALGDMAGERR